MRGFRLGHALELVEIVEQAHELLDSSCEPRRRTRGGSFAASAASRT
jgi:hypothetical protein